MAIKMVTRTLKTYRYTFGRFNLQTLQMDDIKQVNTTYKMNRKELGKYTDNGFTMLGMETAEALYGVPMDVFLANAKLLNPDDRTVMEGIEVV